MKILSGKTVLSFRKYFLFYEL